MGQEPPCFIAEVAGKFWILEEEKDGVLRTVGDPFETLESCRAAFRTGW